MTDAQLISGLAAAILIAAFVLAVFTSADAHLPEAEPLDWTGVVRRKRDAKRFNEHAKLFSTFLNNLGIASIVTMALAPLVQSEGPIKWPRTFMVLMFASVLHTIAQMSLRLWKSEE